ncbi:hypothetical protein Tco_0010399 [Tanacetum coccineum]
MSEAEPIPPTSSVTALRIPMIKKGEYDLWSMKMRQYIAITDHILWDIITNGDQATTDPASSSVPKTSLAANARRNNEKALNILLSAIPDRHLLSFHDATNAKTLWTAIKARFGGSRVSFPCKLDQSEALVTFPFVDMMLSTWNLLLPTSIGIYLLFFMQDLVKEISMNIGGEFINLEIVKCWSLEPSRRLSNTILLNNSTWRIYRAKYQGRFSF